MVTRIATMDKGEEEEDEEEEVVGAQTDGAVAGAAKAASMVPMTCLSTSTTPNHTSGLRVVRVIVKSKNSTSRSSGGRFVSHYYNFVVNTGRTNLGVLMPEGQPLSLVAQTLESVGSIRRKRMFLWFGTFLSQFREYLASGAMTARETSNS